MESRLSSILLPYQQKFVADCSPLKIWLASRQTGKSFAIAMEAVKEALSGRCDNLILSASERQSKEVMRKVYMHLRYLNIRSSKVIRVLRQTGEEASLPNGSRIISLPANPDTVRGFSGNVFLDEFAFHKDAREIWRAMYPAVTRGYKVRVTSTPNGKSNMFYELWSHGKNFSRHFTDIYMAVKEGLPVNIEELSGGVMEPETWAQEFECRFLDEATAFITYEMIASCEDEGATRHWDYGFQSQGIWAVVEWTPRALEYLRNKEYRYLSPVFIKDIKSGRVLRLINAALTNQPAIDGMVPIVNKDIYLRGTESLTQERKEDLMDKGKLCEALGIATDASDEQILEAIAALRSKAEAMLNSLGLNEETSLSEVIGTIEALKQGYEAGKEAAELRAEIARITAEGLVTSAMKEGKITPAQKDWALDYACKDPEAFKVFVAKSAKVIHTAEIAGRDAISSRHHSIDAVQMTVNKALGIAEETFRKYSKEV